MKKTLIALAVTAFVASSAQAVTVYKDDNTNVELGGSLRVLLSNGKEKKSNEAPTYKHSNLVNDGSRLNLRIKHNIAGDDLYALGYAEFRFDGKSKTDVAPKKDAAGNPKKDVNGDTIYEATAVNKDSTKWDDLYTRYAYVGVGGQFGEITFGKQTLIGDEIGLAGFDNAFGVGSSEGNAGGVDILTADSDSAIAYRYTGIKGLTLGANYNFANKRTNSEVNTDEVKSGFGLGAIYEYELADNQKLTASLGYSHDDYTTNEASFLTTQKRHHKTDFNKNGVYAGLAYEIDNLTFAIDGGRAVKRLNSSAITSGYGKAKNSTSFVRLGAKATFNDIAVYGNYGYVTVKGNDVGSDGFNEVELNKAYNSSKAKEQQFMLGSEYQLHKHVKAFVEARLINTKFADHKTKDSVVGVGLRVFF